MLAALMLRDLQYADANQIASGLTPLLALQEMQQSAMFLRLTNEASLMMCSQERRWPRFEAAANA